MNLPHHQAGDCVVGQASRLLPRASRPRWCSRAKRPLHYGGTVPGVVLVALFVATPVSCLGQNRPAWFAKPSSLPSPSGKVVRVANAEAILAAGEQMTVGSTMMVEPGVYTLPRPLVLRQKQDITIRSVSGDPLSVTLKGRGWDLGDEHDDIVHVADCRGVLIAGLTFAECRSYGVKVEAEHGPRNVQIYNCRFRNIGIRAIKGSAGQDPNVYAIKGSVRFCDFENARIPPADWLYGGDYIAGIDMMALEDWTFSDNTFRNIKGRNGGGRAAIFIWVRSRRIIVERNLIVNCDRGISFGNPGQSTANQAGGSLRYVSDGFIQNNIVAGGADCGIELWHAEGIKVRHNSIWRPEQNWGRGIRLGKGVVQTEAVNNLIHGGIQNEGGEANIHHNLAKRVDGYFVEPSLGDLSLTAAATAAIDQGVILNEAPYDVRGLPRKNAPDLGAWEFGASEKEWIEPMRKVHARFHGAPGMFAQFGDSITFSAAFWSPLSVQPKHMSLAVQANYQLAKSRLKPECLNQKGPSFGNQGSMTIQWARENISHWLATLNPEAAVIMFGSNDVVQGMTVEEYEKAVREVVAACLTNGTVVLLTTAPPQSARMQKCMEFAAAIRRVASDLHVPLVDYANEILSRRPFDWDGASAEFKNAPGGTYKVPTLISKDGVHPSNPQAYQNDFSEEGLANSGYGLRNYLTLNAYANVIREVFDSNAKP